MTFSTTGVDRGHIEINVRALGVQQPDEPSLVATVKRMKAVDPTSVLITNGGFLKCQVHPAQCAGSRGERVIAKTHDQIARAAQHKAEVPGRGVERRQQASTNPEAT